MKMKYFNGRCIFYNVIYIYRVVEMKSTIYMYSTKRIYNVKYSIMNYT